jgi:hypothetical protein
VLEAVSGYASTAIIGFELEKYEKYRFELVGGGGAGVLLDEHPAASATTATAVITESQRPIAHLFHKAWV